MDRSNRRQAIQEGRFLSFASDITVKSAAGCPTPKERPYVIPEYDPEGSIARSRLSHQMASMLSQNRPPPLSQDGLGRKTIITEPKKIHTSHNRSLPPAIHIIGAKLKSIASPTYMAPPAPSPRLNTFHQTFGMKSSRLSITPSMLPPDHASTYPGPRRSAHMHTIISEEPMAKPPMHMIKLSEEPISNGPPDGGTQAWMQVFAGFLVVMDAQGLAQSYGVFQAYYQTVLLRQHSPSSIAWIGSFQIFLLFFMAIITSGQIDKGRFRHCFNGGSLLLFACVLATSWCKQYWHFMLVQGIGTGIGMGLTFGAGAQALMTYFRKNLGIATGMASAGGAVGGMIFPAICEKLISRVGFGWTVRVIALVVLITLIPANLIARERPGTIRKGSPQQMDWSAFTDMPYLLVMAGLFFTFWGIYFGFYYIVTYAQTTLHLSPAEATNLLILMNAANLPGRFIPPLISDACLGPINTLIPCTFLTALLLFLWLGADSTTSVHLVACFYGFAAAGIQSLYNATIWGIVTSSSPS
ncbi:MAG: hypothetical protein Q9212_007408, partial [Teloschistes hypoglaucus]